MPDPKRMASENFWLISSPEALEPSLIHHLATLVSVYLPVRLWVRILKNAERTNDKKMRGIPRQKSSLLRTTPRSRSRSLQKTQNSLSLTRHAHLTPHTHTPSPLPLHPPLSSHVKVGLPGRRPHLLQFF